MKIFKALLFFVSLALLSAYTHAQSKINLAGTWHMTTADGKYSTDVRLPGSMLTNNVGDRPSLSTQWTSSLYDSSFYFNPKMAKYRKEGNIKFPFFLTPNRHYVGRVVYSRTVDVPKKWNGKKITLFLERPHIESTLRINGRNAGHRMSLSTPHEYDVSELLTYGASNKIEVEVYNGIENVCVGQDSHSVSDQTQGNWNGIVGAMELRADHPQHVIRIEPSDDFRRVTIIVDNTPYQFDTERHPRLWSEHTPVIYHRTVVHHGEKIDVAFGLRRVAVSGPNIMLNGKPIYLRGTVENCCFPLTGFAPTDVESWVRIIKKCKEYGLNHMRFHSFCPPEDAFVAADSLGFYLQAEGPSWPNHGVRLHRGMSIDHYLTEETKAIIDRYGHHPSFIMLAAGNEPAGDWVGWGADWIQTMHAYDSTRIYCVASVGGGWAWDAASDYHVKAGARGLDWDKSAPQSVDDYYAQLLFPRNYKDSVPNNSPIIAHEQGQWCAFPDLSEINKYRGVYKATNFEIFKDLLTDNNMSDMATKFLHSSRMLQDLAYKYEIERNLRTKAYTGFQLLALNDYSGQGTALVGPLNVFWEEKKDGIDTRRAWRQFCAPAVPLAKLPKFVYTDADTLSFSIDFYNATGKPLSYATLTTTLTNDDGYEIFMSKTSTQRIEEGKVADVANVMIPLVGLCQEGQPVRLHINTSVDGGKAGNNSWQIWVYPTELPEVSVGNIVIADSLTREVVDALNSGKDVLLTAAGKVRYGSDVVHTFLPVFWNTSWFKMRPPHTTGAYIDSTHHVFDHFMTDSWQNINWWELTNRAQVVNMECLPTSLKPIVQPIDTWHISRRLAMMFEARVGRGRIFFTTLDISNNLNSRIVARQLRMSILSYMQSKNFRPKATVEIAQLQKIFTDMAPAVDMFTKDSPDELKPKIK